MGLGWVGLAIFYLAILFWLARWGDKNSPRAKRLSSHPAVYALALGIYCTAWTFYGAVGEASRNSWNYLPILLGPALVYLLAYPFIFKLALVSKKQHITTIADFIASRYGKRQTVALMVTLIALLASIPYIALQLKAIGAAFILFAGQQNAQLVILLATLFIGVFSIIFGTKHTDVTEYRRGLMLAIAFESCIKIMALFVIALLGYVWWQQTQSDFIFNTFTTNAAVSNLQSTSFWMQTFIAGAAVICLPRQFHVAIVDNLDLKHLKTARWMFPLYLLVTAFFIPIIAVVGQAQFGTEVEADTYVKNIAIATQLVPVKMLVFIGGLSAATAMIIVATLTLSTMITNDVILPKLLSASSVSSEPGHYAKRILAIRRVVIASLLLLSFGYYHQLEAGTPLSSIGLLAFSLVVQLLPSVVGGLYWKRGHAHGVYAGLMLGLMTWILWLMLPLLANQGSEGWHSTNISQAAMISLLANVFGYIVFSLLASERLIDKIQAQAYVSPKEQTQHTTKKARPKTTASDLLTLLNTFLGESRCRHLLNNYQQNSTEQLDLSAMPSADFLGFCERALGGVLGSASAKALIDSALHDRKLGIEEVANVFDETTQAIQFNMSALLISLESIEQGISVLDKDLKLVAWNKRYVDLFDYPEGMLNVGTPVEELVRYNAQRGECGVGEIEALVQKRLEHMRRGTPHRFLRQRSDGKMIEMVGNPLPGGGFVTSFSDITGLMETQKALKDANIDLEKRVQKRTQEVQDTNAELRFEIERRAEVEQQLIQARQAAEDANASKTRFLALASHDILQPLNAAKLYVSALQEAGLSEQEAGVVAKLSDSINASETLIATLLDIARLDQGELVPNIESISLLALLTPLVDEFGMAAQQKGLQLNAKIQDHWVKADRTHLLRIVQNLLSNAVKYTDNGKILLTAKKLGRQVIIRVRDTGPGISVSEQEKIFNDFYRIDSHQKTGVGLGLGVVQRLSALLNSRVEVESHLGRGSCFSISLPICEAQKTSSATSVAKNLGFSQLPVLVVDDKPENIDAMQTLLQKWQVQMYAANNVQSALAQVKQHKPKVLLVDYHLNDSLNGLELIKQIRDHEKSNIPSALVTASQEAELIRTCKSQNVSYLSKPVKPAKLRALLKSLQRDT